MINIKNILLTSLLFLFATPAYAQVSDEPPRLSGIATIFDNVFSYLFPIAGIICVIYIIIGGYMWIISAGDPARVKQAQGTLSWAIIGLVVLLVIFAVLKAVIRFVIS